MASNIPIPPADVVVARAWNDLGTKLALEIAIALKEYEVELGMEPYSGEGWLLLGIALNKRGEVV